jgi:hypothetical protein
MNLLNHTLSTACPLHVLSNACNRQPKHLHALDNKLLFLLYKKQVGPSFQIIVEILAYSMPNIMEKISEEERNNRIFIVTSLIREKERELKELEEEHQELLDGQA